VLRNKLLLFRFRNRSKRLPTESLVDRTIEPRLNQIFVPLLTIIDDEAARADLQDLARQYNRELIADRGMDTEAQVLEVIRDLAETYGSRIAIKDVTRVFGERYGLEYDRKVSTRWIGYVVRRRLLLATHKSHGTFVITPRSCRSSTACTRSTESARRATTTSTPTRPMVSYSGDLGTSGT